jgi:radical SAM superfamily enzyme YgiQ (UPF0313 family)
MDKKIISFLIVLLLYLKFGSPGLWLGLVVLVSYALIVVITFQVLRAYAPSFYSEKARPFWKRITGAFPPDFEEQNPEEAKKKARGYLLVTAGSITIILLIYTVLTRFLN